MNTKTFFKLGKLLTVSLFLSVIFSASVHAATCYWVSDGVNPDWDLSSNWSSSPGGSGSTCDGGPNIPDSNDNVIFDGNSDADVNFNTDRTVSSFDMQSGYDGTLNLGDNDFIATFSSTLTSGTIDHGAGAFIVGYWWDRSFNMAGGSFLGGSGPMTTWQFNQTGGSIQATSGTWEHKAGVFNVVSSGFNHNNGTLYVNSNYNTTFNIDGGTESAVTLNNLTLNLTNNTSNDNFTIAAGDDITVQGELKMQDGYLDGLANDSGIILTGTLPEYGTAFLGGDGLLTLQSSNNVSFTNAVTLPKLAINGNLTLTPGGSTTFTDQVTIPQGTIDNSGNHNLTFARELTINGGNFNAGANTTITHQRDVTVSSGTYDGETATALNITGGGLVVSGGLFDATNVGNLDIDDHNGGDSLNLSSGTFETPDASGEMHFRYGVDTSAGGTYNNNGCDVYLESDRITALNFGSGTSFTNVIINKTGDSFNDQVELESDVDINGNLQITDGEIQPYSYTINLAGNWDNDVGTTAYATNHGTGTMNFDGGDVTLTGSTNFVNLTKTTNSTMYFEAGTTTTVTGTWTVTGTSGSPVHLRSTVDGSYWYINPTAYDLDYISVKDSTNTGSTITLSGKYADDIGPQTNVNWDFTGANPLPVIIVPEFSTWMMILTMMVGMGLIYQKREGLIQKI